MGKKFLCVLGIFVLAGGIVFSQGFPRNTVSIDLGPTIIGAVFGGLSGFIPDSETSSSGFGIGAQYEFQFTNMFSAALRGAYLMAGLSITDARMNYSSWSVEGHGRIYPFSNAFFLDAMLGYANFLTEFSGSSNGQKEGGDYSSTNLKVGAKLGWRIDYGRPGGFVFEPALGYYHAIRLNSSKSFDRSIEEQFGEDVEKIFDPVEKWFFAGGPRVSFNFGFRF